MWDVLDVLVLGDGALIQFCDEVLYGEPEPCVGLISLPSFDELF